MAMHVCLRVKLLKHSGSVRTNRANGVAYSKGALFLTTYWATEAPPLKDIKSGGSVVDHTLDYQSRDRKADPAFLQPFRMRL